MAAPTVRGVGAFGSGTTGFTAAVPTGGSAPQAGDAMYIIMESTDSTTTAGTPSTPGGWTKLFENTIAAGSSIEPAVSTLTVFGKIAGAGEADVAVSGVGNHCAGAMIVIAGHGMSAITQTIVGSATDHGTSTTNILAPSINVCAQSLIITCMGLGDDANDTTNVSGVTNANLASITERIDQTVATGSGGGVGIYTATCAGTSTGTTEWDHDTAAASQSMQLGIPPIISQSDGAISSQNSTLSGSGASSSSSTDGAIAAQAAVVAGAGLSTSLSTDGAIAAQAATLAGSGTVQDSTVTGSGVLTAQAATMAGAGASSSAGSGALAAQAATASGAGTSSSSGSGALAAQAAAVDGSGLSLSTGSGALAGQAAQVDGAGASASAGSGTLQAQAASVSGAGQSASSGSGTLPAQAASVDGAGLSASIGTGTLVAQNATVDGSDALQPITGSGALSAAASTASGAGLSATTGDGSLDPSNAVLNGAGLSKSSGSGILLAGNAALVGGGFAGDPIDGTGSLFADAVLLAGVGLVRSYATPGKRPSARGTDPARRRGEQEPARAGDRFARRTEAPQRRRT